MISRAERLTILAWMLVGLWPMIALVVFLPVFGLHENAARAWLDVWVVLWLAAWLAGRRVVRREADETA